MIDKLSWVTIYPEIVLLVMACIIALVDLSTTDARRTRTYVLTLLTLAVVAVLTGLAAVDGKTGYGFGGEGDWKTSVLVRTFKTIGAGLPGGTSFMEDYTYHLGPGPQRILGAHMLEVCPSIASGRPTVEIHPLGIGGREDPVRMRFTAAPGEGVVVGMSDLGDRFRLTGNTVTVVEPDEELRSLPVAAAVWEPHPDLPTSTECWLRAGGPHHTVMSTQLDAATVDRFAELTRTELALIDRDTTPRRFRDELRWNAAYHRLAAAL